MGVLQEYGDSTLDLNVEPAWIQGITGCGVVVGVVDDGKLFMCDCTSALYIGSCTTKWVTLMKFLFQELSLHILIFPQTS